MQRVIPNKEGTLPVTGMEDVVDRYRSKHAFKTTLEAEMDEVKQALRQKTSELIESLGPTHGVRRLEFVASKGAGCVLVSLPDYAEAGNRLKLKDGMLAEAKNLGLDPVAEGLVESETRYVLSASWAEWFKSVVLDPAMQSSAAAGTNLPPGLEVVTDTRLRADAIERLTALAKTTTPTGPGGTPEPTPTAAAAQLLLKAGKKEPPVGVR